MNITIFDVEDWERETFERLREDHELTLTADSLTAQNASQFSDADVISTFVYSDLDDETLKKFDHLKLIATRSTGFDHIDMDHCNDREIAICNVPEYGSATVAEHTFGLLLTISHRLEEAIDRTRKGDFSPRGLQGFDLEGKTFGVIGTGNIGQHVIRIAHGFGMNVIAFDLQPNADAAEKFGFDYVEFDELLKQSDVVSLHVPGSAKTKHLIGADQFKLMKRGAVLINTARGALVDERAMLRSLAEGNLAAAGLDVLSEEPVIREEAELLRRVYEQHHSLDTLLVDQVLIRMRNVVVTPHSAFNTREAVQRIIDTTVDNIVAFTRGNRKNRINAEQAVANV
ncbi:D-lactate dehydrogenase [Rubripirellula obstinata]|uniref:D-lactate dehydrogenase n=1 Tax=Rubripirellula obstinata TaxID=406547 RepID=A0A5B1CL79_9BACT|nr:hydroxyacid dehydrogenase [Rubripirellula obstinata]KAA1261092.1 D-lactate dehydrogenase [Rubripirellula obstinata]